MVVNICTTSDMPTLGLLGIGFYILNETYNIFGISATRFTYL